MIGPAELPAGEVERLASLAAASAGIEDGHVAVTFVSGERIAELNAQFRAKDGPTDVLSFPVDEGGEAFGPRELGDVFICPEKATDVTEAAIHGTLHLCGFDHETDTGQMLALQDKVMASLR